MTYTCVKFANELQLAFGLDISKDDHLTHPASFYSNCKRAIIQILTSRSSGKPYRSFIKVHQWEAHNESCKVCQYFESYRKGGNPKKNLKSKTSQASSDITPAMLIEHLDTISPLLTNSNLPICANISTYLKCPLCFGRLVHPLELPCRKVVCAPCLLKLVKSSGSCQCPCCNAEMLTPSTLKPAPDIFVSVC